MNYENEGRNGCIALMFIVFWIMFIWSVFMR
jgi:hypothetical protein